MVILFGASGFVGQRFLSYLKKEKVEVKPVSRAEMDYTDAHGLRKLLGDYRPDFLINCAGYTGKPNVDACEANRAECLFGNVIVPLRIGEACAEYGVRWGHVSSGCIYQGHKGYDAQDEAVGFLEDDEPNFSFKTGDCSFYSGTKAQAEEWLLKSRAAHQLYIWRLRVPFDQYDSPRNYLSKLMRYDSLLDARNSLSHLDDFVASCWATFSHNLPAGVYNLTNPGSVTARDVVSLIQAEGYARLARGEKHLVGTMLKDYKFFESEFQFMKGVKTPRSNCVLDTSKAQHFNLPLRPVRQALAESLDQWVWESPK
jgi:dTDP-4-dehydrorhamnose reductase